MGLLHQSAGGGRRGGGDVTSRPRIERPGQATGRVDLWGASLAVAFLAGLTYALIEAPTRGWSDPAVLFGLAVTVLAGPAFLLVERRSSHPMLPLELFRSRQFSGANGVTFAVYGALGGALFLLPVELQLVADYTPLAVGSGSAPLDASSCSRSRPVRASSRRASGRGCR